MAQAAQTQPLEAATALSSKMAMTLGNPGIIRFRTSRFPLGSMKYDDIPSAFPMFLLL